jgi:hypothetical protein
MDLERTIEFIVNQQAQFSADIQLLKESQQAMQRQQQAMQDQQQALQQVVLDYQAATQKDIRSLVDVVTSLARLHEGLVGTVQETNSRLNTLIGIVERHISDHK